LIVVAGRGFLSARGGKSGELDMRRIRGESKNLRGLPANARFDVDDYQREYRWEQDQVSELAADLANAFFMR
jgi:hypothetical protein